MQRIADQQNTILKALRKKANDTLSEFNAQDLPVDVRNGNVQVSLSGQILLESGATEVDVKDQEALSKPTAILKENQDVNVLAEGTAGIHENRDSSVWQVTKITRLFIHAGLPAVHITSYKRAQYVPTVQSDSPTK
ncbi:hypothetical protein [Hymenobacter perfusus]|uniref:Uncharacterized protein n=1 Tax=Hymenobacter perfusus TaxID=1236770 RepID=A0A3R9N7Z4_9BACT|nr:hypothetical protein [Hymenobacter perfusus]RSK41148.1 hypothetical protein EI293_17120 [Hymenobacter perfusus]